MVLVKNWPVQKLQEEAGRAPGSLTNAGQARLLFIIHQEAGGWRLGSEAIRGPLPLLRSQGYGESQGLQHTWEEHSGEGVRSPQVVNEDALEGLTAGRLLVPGEGQGVDLS